MVRNRVRVIAVADLMGVAKAWNSDPGNGDPKSLYTHTGLL